MKKLRRERIIRLGIPLEVPGKRPAMVYELAQETIEEKVKNAIREFVDLMQRNPDSNELAREVGGITPQQAEEIAYRTNEETDWYPPSSKQKSKAESLVIMALITAERMRQGVSQDWLQEIPVEERELGKKFLQKYPQLLPTIVDDKVVAWPLKAKAYLTKYIDADTLQSALDQ